MNKKKLQIQQLEKRIKLIEPIRNHPTPPTGWVKAIRLAFGMSLKQLAKKLSISQQSVHELEIREQDGRVTLKSLKDAARALDMEFVYGFVPKEGSLEKYLETKARSLAEKIVYRTSNTMKLEDQENRPERIQKAIEERTVIIKETLPKALWD